MDDRQLSRLWRGILPSGTADWPDHLWVCHRSVFEPQAGTGDVDTGRVTRILEPIWTTKAETAARVRGRIEAVLDYAKTHGWRTGENPARWKGHLQNVLPSRAKVSRVEHQAALSWREIGSLMADLDREAGTAALALRFTILTAARTSEVIGGGWGEMDLAGAVLIVPSERMKASREHRVPLSGLALAVLGELTKLRKSDATDASVCPGGKGATGSKPLSNVAMLMLLRRMRRGDLTPRPFASFTAWFDLVRGALVWLGEADPVATLDVVRANDPVRMNTVEVLKQWNLVIGDRPVTGREIIARAIKHPDFREVLLPVAGSHGAIDSGRLGKWLRSQKGKIVDGRALANGDRRAGFRTWRLHGARVANDATGAIDLASERAKRVATEDFADAT